MKAEMETQKTVTLAFNAFAWMGYLGESFINENKQGFLSLVYNVYGQILLALKKYLEFINKFDRIDISMIFEPEGIFNNGTFVGLTRKINRSEADIGVTPFAIQEKVSEHVDFCYPFGFEDFAFVTRKPNYVPQIFGIFQTLSNSVWITIAIVVFAMMIVYYICFKRKCSCSKILLNAFAILMKQNAIIIPSSLTEKILIMSWVLGAMFLCLSYDSVFLSFLSFPPLNKIKDLSDLASAVKKGDYHCMAQEHSGIAWYLLKGEQGHLRIIGRDIYKNSLNSVNIVKNFIENSRKQNLAYFVNTKLLDYYASSESYFISEDRIYQRLASMMVRKGFCCKDLIDTFIHRMMAAGIYSKIVSDGMFLNSMRRSFQYPKNGTTLRKLTLTDVAPAFIFLLFGYFISFIVLIGEKLINRKSMRHSKTLRMKNGNKVLDENPV